MVAKYNKYMNASLSYPFPRINFSAASLRVLLQIMYCKLHWIQEPRQGKERIEIEGVHNQKYNRMRYMLKLFKPTIEGRALMTDAHIA